MKFLRYMTWILLFIFGTTIFADGLIRSDAWGWFGIFCVLPLTVWAIWTYFWIDKKKGPDTYNVYFQGLSNEELARAREYVKGNISRNSASDPEGTERVAKKRFAWGTHKSEARSEDGEA